MTLAAPLNTGNTRTAVDYITYHPKWLFACFLSIVRGWQTIPKDHLKFRDIIWALTNRENWATFPLSSKCTFAPYRQHKGQVKHKGPRTSNELFIIGFPKLWLSTNT